MNRHHYVFHEQPTLLSVLKSIRSKQIIDVLPGVACVFRARGGGGRVAGGFRDEVRVVFSRVWD